MTHSTRTSLLLLLGLLASACASTPAGSHSTHPSGAASKRYTDGAPRSEALAYDGAVAPAAWAHTPAGASWYLGDPSLSFKASVERYFNGRWYAGPALDDGNPLNDKPGQRYLVAAGRMDLSKLERKLVGTALDELYEAAPDYLAACVWFNNKLITDDRVLVGLIKEELAKLRALEKGTVERQKVAQRLSTLWLSFLFRNMANNRCVTYPQEALEQVAELLRKFVDAYERGDKGAYYDHALEVSARMVKLGQPSLQKATPQRAEEERTDKVRYLNPDMDPRNFGKPPKRK